MIECPHIVFKSEIDKIVDFSHIDTLVTETLHWVRSIPLPEALPTLVDRNELLQLRAINNENV